MIFLSPAGMPITKSLCPGIIKLFPARESLVSDIPVGDGKIDNLFLQCIIPVFRFSAKNCMCYEREGMGLLENQAVSSLRGIAHGGVLCTFTVVIDQPQTGASGVVRQGRRHGPPKVHPAGSLSSSQPGGPLCWANPLAFDTRTPISLIVFYMPWRSFYSSVNK